MLKTKGVSCYKNEYNLFYHKLWGEYSFQTHVETKLCDSTCNHCNFLNVELI